jgi:hypothetical protein
VPLFGHTLRSPDYETCNAIKTQGDTTEVMAGAKAEETWMLTFE